MATTAKRRATSYQIVIKHAGACPGLPDGFAYEDAKATIYKHPIHQVFSQQCTIAEARAMLERLKLAEGITEAWITKDGYTMDRERWLRTPDGWQRNN